MANVRIKWRWDQGRLAYFSFSNIKKIARALNSLDGSSLNLRNADPLREQMQSMTDLPFAPQSYKVWRNYSRVFSCSLLAYSIEGRMAVSNLCKHFVNSNEFEEQPDQYFLRVFRNYSYPHPAFQDYNHQIEPLFPFAALIKFLLSQPSRGNLPQATVDEVFNYLVANPVSGTENLDHYSKLRPSGYQGQDDEIRQLRELMIFASQVSFLKWFNGALVLDSSSLETNYIDSLCALVSPIYRRKESDPSSEFFAMSGIEGSEIALPETLGRELPVDNYFTEGKKRRVNHLRVERSPALRKALFASLPEPYLCEMCALDTSKMYSWTDNILEVHHLLPLSSAIEIETRGTSLDDVVPICSNCHKSVHSYYRLWLKENNLEDFPSKAAAQEVYSQAKAGIQ